MPVRGVRGAIDVEIDEEAAVLQATRQLLTAMVEANPSLIIEDLASVLFTTPPELKSVAPARAARELGWDLVPLLCFQEMNMVGQIPRVIRVLMHWNTAIAQNAINHTYLGEAARLRPDLGST